MGDPNAVDPNATPAPGTGEGVQPGTPPKPADAPNPDAKAPDDKNPDDPPGDKKPNDPPDDEPKVRKTPAEYAKERIEKKKSKPDANPDGGERGKDPSDADELTPEEEEKFKRFVEKTWGPVLKSVENLSAGEHARTMDREVDDFLSDPAHEAFKPYRATIAKWAKHEAYRHIPIEQIAFAAVGDKLLQIGAQRGKTADEEAARLRSAGAGGKDAKAGHKPFKDMTPEELAAWEKANPPRD